MSDRDDPRSSMAYMGIGDEHLNARLENFPQSVRDRVIGVLSAGRGLFVSGLPGRGKTHLAAAILRYVMENRNTTWRTMIYRHEGDLIFDLRRPFGSNESEEPVIDDLARRDILIIDDFGISKVSEFVAQTMEIIIDRRYRNRKITVVTSNFDLEKIAVRLGDRVASRLAGMCEALVLTGADRRLNRRYL